MQQLWNKWLVNVDAVGKEYMCAKVTNSMPTSYLLTHCFVVLPSRHWQATVWSTRPEDLQHPQWAHSG